MSHYVIGYHDLQNNHYEICEYADDAYNAIKQAREDLPDMKASPLSCERFTAKILLHNIWCYYTNTCDPTTPSVRIDNTNYIY